MKSKKIQFLKSIIYFVIIFILVGTYNNIVAEEIYYPSPIIFVHGVDSDDSTWNSAEREMRKYFYNTDGTCKYFDYGYDYLIFAGYADQNNGDIPTIARTALKNEVYYATDRLPDGYKKVNIITHSMGGLVTRSFLKQFSSVYQSNINKVIFIGTPHLGAPSASALWILNKIRNEIIQPALRDYNSFYSQSSGSRFRFADKSGIVIASGLPVGIYNGLTGKLSEELANIDLVLTNADRFGPDPAGTALTQLRLSNNVYYHKTISAGLLWDKKEINIDAMIAGNNTFLGQASQNLAIPNNFKTVRGDISPLRNFFSWILSWGISQTIDLFNNNFTFPQGQSLLDAKNTGDGIVTMASQEGIGSADYIVNAFHTDEPKAWQTILQAIDDPPVIENVRLLKDPSDSGPDYIVVKVKDHLLADVEILELTDADLTSFHDPVTGKNKPYIGYLTKGFLKERDITIPNYGKIHLMPGEFHAELKERAKSGGVYNIRIKNPAGKEASCQVALPVQKDDGVWRYAEAGNWHECGGGCYGWHYSVFPQYRQDAIDEFFNSAISYSYPNVLDPGNQPDFHTSPVGGFAYSRIATTHLEGCGPEGYLWDIDANSDLAPSLEFELAIDKPIKSAKLIGKFQFENYRKKSKEKIDGEEIIEEEKDIAFSISFSNDNFTFVLNTTSRKSGDMVDIPIDQQSLTPNGTNAWTLSAEFLEDSSLTTNCFPQEYIEPPLGRWSHIIYRQKAYIDNPLLVITFEEED